MDILMSSLTQELYWGSSVAIADAMSMATDIQFQTVGQPQTSIELWVDEIEFYGCSSYPTPAGTATDTPAGPTNTWTDTPTWTNTPTWTETPVGPTYTWTNTPEANPGLVDDMEDGDNQNNWGGYWYTFDDLGSSGSSYVVPWSDARWNASGQTPQPFYMQSPGRTGSGYAARMTGYVTTAFQYGFVGMGTTFLEPKGPVDLSSCTGVKFWYKGDGKTYRMKISSSHPNFLDGAGDNHYGYAFVAGASWTQMDILMSSLTQELYWGSSVARADAMSMATDIQFQTVGQPQTSIELWVDEIEFYGCSSYPTPGGTPAVTNTWTNTPGGPTYTYTWTNTPGGPTNTWTHTPTWTATSGTGTPTPTPAKEFKFDDSQPIVAYPNPHSIATPVSIDFYLSKPAEVLYFRLYTSSGRLVREVPYTKNMVNNRLLQGKNTVAVGAEYFKGMAQGTYYYVLVAEDNTKKQVKSKIEKIIILR